MKFIDYGATGNYKEHTFPYEMNKETLKQIGKETEDLWKMGIRKDKYSKSKHLSADLKEDYLK